MLSYRALPQRVAALRKLVNLAKVSMRVYDTTVSLCCAMAVSHFFFSLRPGLLRVQQLFRHVGHPVRTQPQLHQPLEEDMEGTFTLLPLSVAAALPTTLTPLTT